MCLQAGRIMSVPESARDVLSNGPQLGCRILNGRLNSRVGFSGIVGFIVAVRSVDCIGGEAPHTKVRRDMCCATDETGVD